MPHSRVESEAAGTVLVVEDDQAVARVLAIALRCARFNVVAVMSGREALEMLETRPVDAVVLDLGLPDQLGTAVLDRLRNAGRESQSPAPEWLVISALDSDEVHRRCGPLGDRFLRKPFDPRSLVTMLERLIG